MTNNEKLRYSMLIQWSERDQKYLVKLPEWQNSIQEYFTDGDTYEEAAKNGREVLEMFMEHAKDDDKALPEPQEASYEWTEEDEKFYKALEEDNEDDANDKGQRIIEDAEKAKQAKHNKEDSAMKAKVLWQATLERLQTEIGKAAFETWFKNTSAISLKDGVLVIHVTTPFAQTQLEGRFIESIRTIASDIAAMTIDIRFEVASNPQPQSKLQ